MTDTTLPAAHKTQLPDHQRRMEDLLGGVANIANSIAEAGGVASAFPFIGINNDGIWAYGQERTEVEEGSLWALDIRTLSHGYIAWPPNTAKERKPLGERMVPASAPLPAISSLPDVGQPYQLQFAFELLCMSGEDTGIMALYKNGSYGAKVIIQTLVEEIRRQARNDPANLCPLVELRIRSYFHSEWKKTIHNPVLHIHKWISFDNFDGFERVNNTRATITADPQPAPAPAPAPVAAAPAPAPAPAQAAGPVPVAAGRRRPAMRAQPA
jgi:hypothetical protein